MDKTKKQPSTAALAATIGLKLLIVCAVVAALISGVNSLTDAKYQENLTAEKRRAIISIFNSETLTYQTTNVPDYDSYVQAYQVNEGDALLGYCVEVVSGEGFGGDISMMVGFNADKSIKGVSIVSLNETPGLGARVKENAYLSQYEGKSGALILGENIDAISGATISSRAVLNGVNRAVEIVNAMPSANPDNGGNAQ